MLGGGGGGECNSEDSLIALIRCKCYCANNKLSNNYHIVVVGK